MIQETHLHPLDMAILRELQSDGRTDLERFVVEQLTPIPGVARIHTSLVLSEIKATAALPLK